MTVATYFDASALVAFVVPGPRTRPLRRWWSRRRGPAMSSRVARTELMRSVRRVDPQAAPRALDLLGGIELVVVTSEVLDRAGCLDPVSLGSLDAIHLASALDLGSELKSFVTYDERLADAARRNGLPVVTPG